MTILCFKVKLSTISFCTCDANFQNIEIKTYLSNLVRTRRFWDNLLKAYLGCVICSCNRFHSLVRTTRFWTFWKHTWVVLSVTASLQQVSFNINQTSQRLHTHWRWRCGPLSLEMSISQNYGKHCRCLPRFIQILKQSWNKDYIYLLWIHISKDF